MARILILLLLLLSLWRLDHRRAKELLRRLAIRLCRVALDWLSPPYVPNHGPAIFFAPHQDDETLGCGGLIARKRYEGLPVQVVFITDGSASHPGHSRFNPREIAAIRRAEACEALAILGVESNAIHFLNAPDGRLNQLDTAERARLVGLLAAHIGAVRPQEIFLPCSPDGSTEHDAAFLVICEAIRRTGLFPVIWQYPVWSWWNPLLLLERLISGSHRCHQPTEDFQNMKALALRRYVSQTAPLAPDTVPALPADLVRIFRSDTEFFFRFDLPPTSGPSGFAQPVV